MSGTSYARFHKCDLHMHTPLDSHWRETSTRLAWDDPEGRQRQVARSYLEACHQAGLEVIAVTDHNFAPKPQLSFVRWLREENKDVAERKDRQPLVIFSGFELEADIGRGCHILCVFPPDTPPDIVDSRLTALGLPPDKRFDERGRPRQSTCRLQDALRVVQEDLNSTGIVIAPHPFDNGVLDDGRLEIWLQQEEFRTPALLCLEIPKPLEQLPKGLQKLLLGGEDCLPEWRRERPMAYVMSSDCYRLSGDEREHSNFIGFRHTWIKMSQPSIESLRQAFLDRESRLRFGPTSPDDQYGYPKIRRVAVQGTVFLRRPEEIRWSPNLNCLIGSRGTGKSTLLDYIRLALDRLRREDLDLPASLITEVEDRVRDTLTSTARIEVELETRGGVYQVVYSSSEVGMGRRLVFPVGAELPDPHLDVRALFPCRILSQHQIDHSVSRRDRAALRKFLDDFIRCRLDELERKGQDLKGKIGQIDAALAAKTESQKRRPALETEQRDLMGRLEGQKRLREALPYWQGVEMESDFFERLFVELEEVVSTWRGRLEDLELKSTLISEDLRTTPDAALIAEAAGVADTAVQRLREAIENDLRVFEHIFRAENSALLSLHRERWLPLFVEYRRRLEAAQAEAGVRETSVQAITEMSRRLLTLRAELAALDQEQRQIAQLEVERQAVLKGLRQVWREQTEARLSKAQELMDRLRPGPGRRPYVEIRVEHQADRDEFVKVLSLKIPDKRRLNEDDIRSLVDRLAGEGFANVPPPERFIVEARGGERSQILKEVLIQDRRREAFRGIFTESVLRQLETERIPDFVMYYVYRKDGTLAGPIDKVSAGQQGTAILNLLLAAGDEPLIVDTPEEGLDNEGVYAELVPLFRSAKEKRQIIVVTHNANLPVNADAEAIVALEAAGFVEDGTLSQILDGSGPVLNSDQRRHLASLIRWPDWETKVRHYLGRKQGWPTTVVERVVAEIGRVRQAEGRLKRLESVSPPVAVGALDAPAVKRAVQDIMEGSEEAFRRRQEKYGF